MKTKTKAIVLAIVLAIPALLLGRVIWPDAHEIVQPTSGEFPFYAFLALVEALAFGFGVSFLIFAWRRVRAAGDRLTTWAYLAVGWFLISWWPHDNLHRANGMDTRGLLYIEYGFHLTLIIGGVISAAYLLRHVPGSGVSREGNL